MKHFGTRTIWVMQSYLTHRPLEGAQNEGNFDIPTRRCQEKMFQANWIHSKWYREISEYFRVTVVPNVIKHPSKHLEHSQILSVLTTEKKFKITYRQLQWRQIQIHWLEKMLNKYSGSWIYHEMTCCIYVAYVNYVHDLLFIRSTVQFHIVNKKKIHFKNLFKFWFLSWFFLI